jgi:hypothetical protein
MERITENEALALQLARAQVENAQLRLELVATRLGVAHQLGPTDSVQADGTIVRGPTPASGQVTPPAPETTLDTPAQEAAG